MPFGTPQDSTALPGDGNPVTDTNTNPVTDPTQNPTMNTVTETVGTVGDDGTVVDGSGNVLGMVMADGTVVDADGNIVGVVGEDGTVVMTTPVVDTNDTTTTPPKEVAVCVPGIPQTSQIIRLSGPQYDKTLRDLVGVSGLTASSNAAPSTLLAADQDGSLTELGWSSYKTVAEMAAAQVMADPTAKAQFMSCDPAATGCLQETIATFGRKAFRRPLTDAEVARFETLVSKGDSITENGTPEEVAETLLYTFLTSPSFLTLAEITETPGANGEYILSSHEVATRLSYMMWGTMPDATLSAAADNNELSSSEQILAQAQRMLQDPKAREMVAGFHRDYLLLGNNTRWDSITRDTAKFPEFSTDMMPTLAAETEKFFDAVAFDKGGTFQDFLLSPTAFVNAETAPLYGLNAADFGTELQEVTLDATQRPGFLTRVGFLNAYSQYNRTSPILRGAFIIKDILGTDPGAPDPAAAKTPLPEGADLDTNRKQVAEQTKPAGCDSCHGKFVNPPGFVMEAFNAIGQLQTNEADTGAPIDTVADVMIDGQLVTVTGPADMMGKIASSVDAQRQYAEKWVRYAYRRDGHPEDVCVAEDLQTRISASGYTVLNLITDLTQTEAFRTRAVDTEVAQ